MSDSSERQNYSRRRFIGGAVAATATAAVLAKTARLAADDPPPVQRKIKLGWVGCGGRGLYLVPFFKEHGGYEIHAAADYRPDAVERFGKLHEVDTSRRFSGLSGYKKVIESGAEAIVLEVPPCFFPEQATAAVAAGLHVYMAKPVAVDVPGCLAIEAAGKAATEKQRVFLVDYQLPNHQSNIVVADLWRREGGKTVKMTTVGVGGSRPDLPRGKTIEPWLYHSVWDNHIAMGGGFIVSYDIHAIDAAIWLLSEGRNTSGVPIGPNAFRTVSSRVRPVSATGDASLNRPSPHSDSPDVISVVYRYADGLVHEHTGMGLGNGTPGDLTCRVYSPTARAVVAYQERAIFQQRGQEAIIGKVEDMYHSGPLKNIDDFYRGVTEGHFENPTVRRAVDGCLTCILGREAALRQTRLTMEDLLKENKRLELDLTGLRA